MRSTVSSLIICMFLSTPAFADKANAPVAKSKPATAAKAKSVANAKSRVNATLRVNAKVDKNAKSGVSANPTVTVWTRGYVDSTRRLFKPGLPVRVLGSVESKERDRQTGHLQPRERNALFRKVGIETKVASMDEMDKDMLVMAAREYTVRELKIDFPKLSENQLQRLKEELGKLK